MNIRHKIMFFPLIMLSVKPAAAAAPRSESFFASTTNTIKKHPFATAGMSSLLLGCCIYRMQSKKDKKYVHKNEQLLPILDLIRDEKKLSEKDENFCGELCKSNMDEFAMTLQNYKSYREAKKNYKNCDAAMRPFIAQCIFSISETKSSNDEKIATSKSLNNFNTLFLAVKKKIDEGTVEVLARPIDIDILDTIRYGFNPSDDKDISYKQSLLLQIDDFNKYAAAFIAQKNAPANLITLLTAAHQPEPFFTKKVIGAIIAGSALGIAGAYALHAVLN